MNPFTNKEYRIFPNNTFIIIIIRVIIGIILLIFGLIMFCWSNFLYHKIGKGTMAPYDGPKYLVVNGIYGYVRHPMFIGGLLIILAESFIIQKDMFIFVHCILMTHVAS